MIDAVGFAMFQLVLESDQRAARGDVAWRGDPVRWLTALSQPGVVALEAKDLVLRRNGGRGDCLFHALAGREMYDGEVREVRHTLAGRIARMRPAPRATARRVIAALLQTPRTRNFGIALARKEVRGMRNGTMAALVSVRGVYAGELELRHWCAVAGDRVFVAEASGRFCEVGPRGMSQGTPCARDTLLPLQRALAEGRIVLFKSQGHWQRVVGVPGT